MDKKKYLELISQVKLGKQLPDAIYLHADALQALPNELVEFIPLVSEALKLDKTSWNLIKLFKKECRISFLNYPDFYKESYPSLQQSITVDLLKMTYKTMSYDKSDNPPILHRKETMILADNPYYEYFVMLTEEGEAAGLYENSRIIGFKQSWENLITRQGYLLSEGRIIKSTAPLAALAEDTIDRHKTAIVRHELSSPLKTLAKHNYLSGDYSLFDYGCGRGDDLRELIAHGVDAAGWDPNFQPDNEKIVSDIVNLGFVLNVIESRDERLEVLLRAWELSSKLLVVSVMIANDNYISQFKPYKDGVVTSRNTFQKYYSQAEIKGYIERSLQDSAIAVAPGIFYIFKDKLEEQKYLQNKYKRGHQWQQLTSPESIADRDKAKLVIQQNRVLFEGFWNTCLELGRIPANDEFEHSEQIRSLVGSHKKTFSLLQELFDEKAFKQAEKRRKEDLLLYIAMGLFEQRKPYSQQPEELKRDIKAFFSDYKTANNLAVELLFALSDTQLIKAQCEQAYELLPASLLNKGHSLIFHKHLLPQLPLLLRTYVGAALQIYGELSDDIDLVKIHITSSKLTLTNYDNFESSVPYLVERIKIKMAEQSIDFFDYTNEKHRPPLLNKHLYLLPQDPNYQKQQRFDQRLLKALGYSSTEELTLSRQYFEQSLSKQGKRVQGFRLMNTSS